MLRLFRKIAMGGDAHDLLIEAEAEKNFGDIGSQGDDPFGGKGEHDFPSDFVYEFRRRRGSSETCSYKTGEHGEKEDMFDGAFP